MLQLAIRPFSRIPLASRAVYHHHRVIVWSSSSAANSSGTVGAVTQSNGPRRFYDFKYRDSEDSASPPAPPEPPKDFHKEYVRRPLYGYALKGNMAYKQVNWVLIKVIAVTAVFYLASFGGIYYHHYYVRSEEERQALYRQTLLGKQESDPEGTEFIDLLSSLEGASDMSKYLFREEDLGHAAKRDEGYGLHPDEYFSPNVHDIVDKSQVYKREHSGRKDAHKKLADFDAELRK